MSRSYKSYPKATITYPISEDVSYCIIFYYGTIAGTQSTVSSNKQSSGTYTISNLQLNNMYTLIIAPFNNNDVSGVNKIIKIDTTPSVAGVIDTISTAATTKIYYSGNYSNVSVICKMGTGDTNVLGDSLLIASNVVNMPYIINDLSGNTTYSYSLIPYKNSVQYSNSTPINFYTNQQAAYNLTAATRESNRIQVSFTSGLNSGIVSYILRNSDSTKITVGYSSPLWLSGLTEGTDYSLMVDTSMNSGTLTAISKTLNTSTIFTYTSITTITYYLPLAGDAKNYSSGSAVDIGISLTNNPVYSATAYGTNSKSLYFDKASSQYASATITLTLDSTTGFSICFWVKSNKILSGTYYWGRIFTLNGSGIEISFGIASTSSTASSTGTLTVQFNPGGSLTTNVSLNTNVWVFVVFTMSTGGTGTIYVNGTSNVSGTITYPTTKLMTKLWLGGTTNYPNDYCTANLNSVVVYNSTVLTSAQVTKLYNIGY